MKKTTKALLMAACALALVLTTVMGTVAYLTNTKTVTNTFTVGNVTITMDEAKVDENGKKITGEGASRVTENSYTLSPGHVYDKDPIIYVDAKSADCWLFIQVQNGLTSVEDTESTIASQLTQDNAWELVDAENNVYAYKTIAQKSQEIATFATFTVAETADNDDFTALGESATIKVNAFAVQADGFETAQAAWNACGAGLLEAANPANP